MKDKSFEFITAEEDTQSMIVLQKRNLKDMGDSHLYRMKSHTKKKGSSPGTIVHKYIYEPLKAVGEKVIR